MEDTTVASLSLLGVVVGLLVLLWGMATAHGGPLVYVGGAVVLASTGWMAAFIAGL